MGEDTENKEVKDDEPEPDRAATEIRVGRPSTSYGIKSTIIACAQMLTRALPRLPFDLILIVSEYELDKKGQIKIEMCSLLIEALSAARDADGTGTLGFVLCHGYTLNSQALKGIDAVLMDILSYLVNYFKDNSNSNSALLRVRTTPVVLDYRVAICRTPDGCGGCMEEPYRTQKPERRCDVYLLNDQTIASAVEEVHINDTSPRPLYLRSPDWPSDVLFCGPFAPHTVVVRKVLSGAEMTGNSCDPANVDTEYVHRAIVVDVVGR